MAKILLSNLNLKFPRTFDHDKSLRNRLSNLISNKKSQFELISSLKNINLDLKDGDIVGIIGPNGSGKSSLLRIISGIYYPTSGKRYIEGQILTLLDLNTGMELESSGYENIYLLSYLRGYKKEIIKKFIYDVIEFSELGDAILKPVRTYSSGMIQRLAASMVLHFDADILLLDEFISTGDKNFKIKFSKHMKKKLDKTKIVIIASHDEILVKKICNRVLLIQKGEINEISPSEILIDKNKDYFSNA